MKVLITGGSGQVGFELRRQLATLGEIVAPNRAALDLLDAGVIVKFCVWPVRRQSCLTDRSRVRRP